jgi:hypothetical protein
MEAKLHTYLILYDPMSDVVLHFKFYVLVLHQTQSATYFMNVIGDLELVCGIQTVSVHHSSLPLCSGVNKLFALILL